MWQREIRPHATELTDADRAAIDGIDHATLCRWSCILNTWGWPVELPEPETEDECRYHDSTCRRYLFLKLIENIVGHKEVLRYWNTKFISRPMTDREFEEKWPNHCRRCGEHS